MERWINNKNKEVYVLVDADVINATNGKENDSPLVLYMDREGKRYVRDKEEFAKKFTISTTPLIEWPELSQFAERRAHLGIGLREVAKGTGVSTSTISRMENGHESEYSNVKKVHDYYCKKGV